MKKKKFKHWSGWTHRRFAKLPEEPTTMDVRDVLKINERTLRMWTADAYFQQAEVVSKIAGRLLWNKDRLAVWLTAVGAITQAPEEFQDKLPWYTKEEARAELNIPSMHVIENSPRQEQKNGNGSFTGNLRA
jgi:hypothetical protein